MGRPRKRRRESGDETSGRNPDFQQDAGVVIPPSSSRHGSDANVSTEPSVWDELVQGSLGAGDGHRTIDLDLRPFDGAFTPNGSLQSWLQPQIPATAQWEGLGSGSVPGLTPDSSAQSPPILNLPAEMRTNTSNNQHHHSNGHQPHRDTSTQLLLDPTMSTANLGVSSSPLPTCACLSSMYLAMNTLQTMETFPFPFALHPLREAMATASDVLDCDNCRTSFITAIQNTQLIGTLLMSIADRFGRVIESINTEATRAETANEQKTFRLADLNTATSHLHTGGLGCAAAFSLNLAPAEWRRMTKKVVRAEVHGPADGNECCMYFLALTKKMQERQRRWHSGPVPADFPTDSEGNIIGGPRIPKEDHICMKLPQYGEKVVAGFDWS